MYDHQLQALNLVKERCEKLERELNIIKNTLLEITNKGKGYSETRGSISQTYVKGDISQTHTGEKRGESREKNNP